MKPLERITVVPGKCGGHPCLRGTRFRVMDSLELLAVGASHDEILRGYASCKRGLKSAAGSVELDGMHVGGWSGFADGTDFSRFARPGRPQFRALIHVSSHFVTRGEKAGVRQSAIHTNQQTTNR